MAKSAHVLDEPAQLRQFLRNLRLQDEGAFATPDFDQAPAYQILDGLANRGSTDGIFLHQLRLVRKPASGRIRAGRDIAGEKAFYLGIKRQRTTGIDGVHPYIVTS